MTDGSESVYRTITVYPKLLKQGIPMSASKAELKQGDDLLEIDVRIEENHRIKKIRRIYVKLFDETNMVTLDTVENYLDKGLI
jgi:hypothetical protein